MTETLARLRERDAEFAAVAMSLVAERQASVTSAVFFVAGVGISLYLWSFWPFAVAAVVAIVLNGFILVPAELRARRLTGLSQAAQRDLRRRYRENAEFRKGVQDFMIAKARFNARR